MRRIGILALFATVMLTAFCGIAEADNWVSIIDTTNKKGIQFEVYMDVGRTVLHKKNYDPFDYVGDTISTEIKYSYSKDDFVIQEGNRGYTFSVNGQWYASSGGHRTYTNVFGTFPGVEDSFTMRELYDKDECKICKAVLDYYFSNIAQQGQ